MRVNVTSYKAKRCRSLLSSSRKDESNADFPVPIGPPVWDLEVISLTCLAQARCHFVSVQESTQSRSHRLPVSTHRLPVLNVVGPVQIESAVRLQSKLAKSRATCHRLVPRAIVTWYETYCIPPDSIAVVGPGRTNSLRCK